MSNGRSEVPTSRTTISESVQRDLRKSKYGVSTDFGVSTQTTIIAIAKRLLQGRIGVFETFGHEQWLGQETGHNGGGRSKWEGCAPARPIRNLDVRERVPPGLLLFPVVGRLDIESGFDVFPKEIDGCGEFSGFFEFEGKPLLGIRFFDGGFDP